MAEAIVHLVLNKLAEAAVKETLRLYGAGGQLDSLQHELRWIQAFLKDAETKQSLNERAKTWVSEVREVAFRIEDVIDTFMADVDDHNDRRGVINALKQVLKNPKKLSTVRNLASEMDAIQSRLQEIKECTERYGINRELKEDSSSSAVRSRRPFRGVVLPEDDPDVVGLETDVENIVELLLDKDNPRRRVVSIVGQGGLGKTTVAKKAYNSDKVKREFEILVWVSISQQFEFLDVLSMILEGIRSINQDEKDLLKDPKSQPRAVHHFVRELNRSLKEKRYLIIMDDVWTPDLWEQVKEVIPDIRNGSRVLITTRNSEIGTRADPTCNPYNLHYLSEEESQQLLLKKAFPFQDPKAYLDGLSDLPKKFVRKCGNLPLALIVVGGRLARELPTYTSWHKILQKLNWHDGDGKNCIEILDTSYEDIPAYLKPCFMYFALFPEDYQINAKFLIQLWVSEGFIPEKHGTTMEETAMDYLEELVQRSMIQVSKRYYNGSIKHCRIHDLLRDLAIQKAKENNFLQIISNQDDKCCSSSTFVRRAALHCDRNDTMQYTGPNLRSLFHLGKPNVARFRQLKICCEMNKNSDPKLLKFSKKLSQLRYLGKFGFRRLERDGHEYLFTRPVRDGEYWKSISRMRNLQTLHIDELSYLPQAECIWNITSLRHVILPPTFLGPPPTTDLPNLQTLKTVIARESWLVEGWPKMPSIRVLWLTDLKLNYEESFRNFLSCLQHLTSLHISAHYTSKYELLDMSSFPSYNHVESLFVNGNIRWKCHYRALDICLFPIHLIKLTLCGCKFEEDPMPVIEKLKYLRKLVLSNGEFCSTVQLSCSARGFACLEYLELNFLIVVVEWKVEKGGMHLLKEIVICNCPFLVAIPELQHMTRLKKFDLRSVFEDLRERLQGEESYKLQHIPSVTIK